MYRRRSLLTRSSGFYYGVCCWRAITRTYGALWVDGQLVYEVVSAIVPEDWAVHQLNVSRRPFPEHLYRWPGNGRRETFGLNHDTQKSIKDRESDPINKRDHAYY